MPLYSPPLLLKSKKDICSQSHIEDALKGLEHSYFYNGKRLGNSDNIELNVTTVIMDADENLFLRSCHYSGQKDTWKEVIKDQLIQHLKDIGVEKGLVRSETRYFEVSPEQHLPIEKYESRLLEFISKIERKQEDNQSS
jgi:hypothetical protein